MTPPITLKRKNIDLPVETLQKLSILAVAQEKSLKKYIESLLISKADSLSVEIKENPSPSGDPWFDNPENMATVERGVAQMNAGEGQVYSTDELKNMLGL